MDEPIHILSTRPLDAALEADLLRSGFRLDTVPFIATIAVEDDATQQRLEQAMLDTLTVVFTSANAVQAVSECTQGAEPDWEVYGLEHATYDRILKLLPGLPVIGTAADATALAERILLDAPTRPLVFFCGDQRRDELPERLNRGGLALEELVVYRTIEQPVRVDPIHDAVLFFSPSAVKSYFNINRPKAGCIFFAIGNTTAAAIREQGDHLVVISPSPSAADLVRTVTDHFAKIQ